MEFAAFWSTFTAAFPHALAEAWDNTGVLLAGDRVTRALVCIDITDAVVDEAVRLRCDLVLAYHPILFKAVKAFDNRTRAQRIALRLARAQIAVVTPHTILDSVNNGINDWLLSVALGVQDIAPLRKEHFQAIEPTPENPASIGKGRAVTGVSVTPEAVVQNVRAGLMCPLRVAYPAVKKEIVESVAVCCGSGGMMFAPGKYDVVVTGEMGHHEVLEHVSAGTVVVLSEHTETERGYLPFWITTLKGLFPAVEFFLSTEDKSPLVYLQ